MSAGDLLTDPWHVPDGTLKILDRAAQHRWVGGKLNMETDAIVPLLTGDYIRCIEHNDRTHGARYILTLKGADYRRSLKDQLVLDQRELARSIERWQDPTHGMF